MNDVTPLLPGALGDDPIEAFSRWLHDASTRGGMAFPNAACLATVGEDGWPQGRIVLLKDVGERGFVFYTNYRSTKGRALARQPRAALTFYWDGLSRQVRVRGAVEQVSEAESDDYFRTRHRGSQVGAWASHQSEPLVDPTVLEDRCREVEALYEGRDIPRPSHWGGFLLRPTEIEFWQGREDRLHDRIVYRRAQDDEVWTTSRLNP